MDVASSWFSDALIILSHQAPEVALTLHAEDSIVDHLKFTRDLYVRVSKAEKIAGLKHLTECQTRAIMVEAPCHLGKRDLTGPEDVAQCSRIEGANPGAPAMTLRSGKKIVFSRPLRVSDSQVRVALTRGGAGVVDCLQHTVADDIQAGRLVHLLPDQFSMPLNVVIGTPHKRPSAAIRYVAERLAEGLP